MRERFVKVAVENDSVRMREKDDTPMSNENETDSKTLVLKIRRIRSRVSAGVKTGAPAGSFCPSRTDPTVNGTGCPTNFCGTLGK
jgi:hypothetical protein